MIDLEYMKNILKNIKWFTQRGARGWADCDVPNMDLYLSSVIPAMLAKLSESNEHSDELRDIAAGFYAYALYNEDNWYDETLSDKENQKRCKKAWSETQKSLDKSCKLLAKHFGDLWD